MTDTNHTTIVSTTPELGADGHAVAVPAVGHDHAHAVAEHPPMPQLKTRAKFVIPLMICLVLVGLALGTLAIGALPKQAERKELERTTAENASRAPKVLVVTVEAASPVMTVTLPARLEAKQDVSIFPRESGYIESFNYDLGDEVKGGDVLATLSTPVLDEQLRVSDAAVKMAQAAVAQANAQVELSKSSLKRIEGVRESGAVSAEAVDQARAVAATDTAALASAEASLASAQADRERYGQQKRQATITAPFDGEVTLRGYDLGALVVADKTDNSTALFHLTDRSIIRAFIELPQSAAVAAKVGQTVRLNIRELPLRKFEGTIVRAAPSLSAESRTRLVEARFENSDRTLLPGMFATASIDVPREPRPVMLPGEGVFSRGGQPSVAVVMPDSTIEYRTLTVSRDMGTRVEATAGVQPGEKIIVNLSQQLDAGTKVDAVDRPKADDSKPVPQTPGAPANSPAPLAPRPASATNPSSPANTATQ